MLHKVYIYMLCTPKIIEYLTNYNFEYGRVFIRNTGTRALVDIGETNYSIEMCDSEDGNRTTSQ